MLHMPYPSLIKAFASLTAPLILLLFALTAHADEGPSEKDLLLEEI